jgi:hypothetical protein
VSEHVVRWGLGLWCSCRGAALLLTDWLWVRVGVARLLGFQTRKADFPVPHTSHWVVPQLLNIECQACLTTWCPCNMITMPEISVAEP